MMYCLPEQADRSARDLYFGSGNASIMKCSSGVFVNMHAVCFRTGPYASGSRSLTARPITSSSSGSNFVRHSAFESSASCVRLCCLW